MPLLRVMMDGLRLPLLHCPLALGEHTDALLHSVGYGADDITALLAAGVVAGAEGA